MSNPTENDLFIGAFEPMAADRNRRQTKRRSSILKTDINYGNEERRTSRRVSWAQTYERKEVLADGTTVIMYEEFQDKSEDQLIEASVSASALIARLKSNKTNTSMNQSFHPGSEMELTLDTSSMDLTSLEDNDQQSKASEASTKMDLTFLSTKSHKSKSFAKTKDITDQLSPKDRSEAPNASDLPVHPGSQMELTLGTSSMDSTSPEEDNDQKESKGSETSTKMDLTFLSTKSQKSQSFAKTKEMSDRLSPTACSDAQTASDPPIHPGSEMELTLDTSSMDSTSPEADNDQKESKDTETSTKMGLTFQLTSQTIESFAETNDKTDDLLPTASSEETNALHPTIHSENQMDLTFESCSSIKINETMGSTKSEPKDSDPLQDVSQINVENCSSIRIDVTIHSAKSETSSMDSTSLQEDNDQKETKDSETCSQMDLTFQSTNSQTIESFAKTNDRTDRLSLTTRSEAPNARIRKVFGIDITEQLKKKRDEIEAKRRLSVITSTFTSSKRHLSEDTIVEEKTEPISSLSSMEVTSTSSTSDSSDNNTSKMEADRRQSVFTNSNVFYESVRFCDSVPMAIPDNPIKRQLEDSIDFDETPKKIKISTIESSPESGSESSESQCESSKETESESPLELTSASPLSISVVHSLDDHLMSSPTTIDPTLNFTFHQSESEDSFDPFIHTNRSFHTNRTFYESSSPLQLSFMVREDTLCILADELERQLEDIVIPTEEQKLSIETLKDMSGDMFSQLRSLDPKENGFAYEMLSEEKALISYLWGTFALEIRFGDVIAQNSLVRKIVSINMKSFVSAEEPLQMRQNNLILKFDDSHKPLITIAHDLIISSFESERQQIIARHKTTESLHELVSYISVKVLSAKKLLTELRIISSSEICRLYPKKNDRYRLVIEILGLRKPIYLVVPLNAKSYPDEVIHPIIKINDSDRHLYCLKQFSAAFLRIESRKFEYIRRLIWATKAFIRAKKKVIYEKQKHLKQKKEIQSAKLTDSILKACPHLH